MRTVEKTYDLFSPTEVDFFGQPSHPDLIGTVRCAVCRLTEEESTEGDVERSRQRYTGCVRAERAPLGGFVRGMELVDGDARYSVRSATKCGRLWLLSLDRVIFDGEA